MTPDPDTVEQDLSKLLQAAHLVGDLLTQEQEALSADPSALTSVAEQKTRDTQRLNDRVVAFLALIDTDQVGEGHNPRTLPNAEDMRAFFSALGRPELTGDWQALQQMLEQIAEQNRVNGHRVQVMAGHVDRALSILSSGEGEQIEKTYGSNGQFSKIVQSRRHTRA